MAVGRNCERQCATRFTNRRFHDGYPIVSRNTIIGQILKTFNQVEKAHHLEVTPRLQLEIDSWRRYAARNHVKHPLTKG